MKYKSGREIGRGGLIAFSVIALTWTSAQANPSIPLEPVSVENEGPLLSLQSLSSSQEMDLDNKLLLKYYQPRHVHISYGGNW